MIRIFISKAAFYDEGYCAHAGRWRGGCLRCLEIAGQVGYRRVKLVRRHGYAWLNKAMILLAKMGLPPRWAFASNPGESEMDFAIEVKFRSRFRHLQGQIDHKDKCSTSSGIIRSTDKEKNADENGVGHHKRSFSVVIKRHSTKKSSSSSNSLSSDSSSSSSSNNSNGFHELQFFKRCSSSSSNIEISIQGAIAHCKQSQ
jgi:hypothetical protein